MSWAGVFSSRLHGASQPGAQWPTFGGNCKVWRCSTLLLCAPTKHHWKPETNYVPVSFWQHLSYGFILYRLVYVKPSPVYSFFRLGLGFNHFPSSIWASCRLSSWSNVMCAWVLQVCQDGLARCIRLHGKMSARSARIPVGESRDPGWPGWPSFHVIAWPISGKSWDLGETPNQDSLAHIIRPLGHLGKYHIPCLHVSCLCEVERPTYKYSGQ